MIFRPKRKILLGVIFAALLLTGIFIWLVKPEEPAYGWKTVTNSQGIEFQYPEQFPAVYISAMDWPPMITVTEGPYTCPQGGEEIDRAGKTEERMVNDRTYCVTKVTEGAAGSIYTQYSYITAHGNNKLVNLTFTLRYVQCGNYHELQTIQCEEERAAFDIDSIVDRIVKTI